VNWLLHVSWFLTNLFLFACSLWLVEIAKHLKRIADKPNQAEPSTVNTGWLIEIAKQIRRIADKTELVEIAEQLERIADKTEN